VLSDNMPVTDIDDYDGPVSMAATQSKADQRKVGTFYNNNNFVFD